MADEAFQNLVKALYVLAARRADLNVRVDTATLEIDDYLARSTDEDGDLERVRKAVRTGAEMAEEQRPNQVAFWTTVQEYLGSLGSDEP
jgi:hypothetical protein